MDRDSKNEDRTLVRADRMLDVENGKIRENGVVVVVEDRIESVGLKDVPTDTRTIDLGDMTLLPGLMDMHTHLTIDFSGDWNLRLVKETPADRTLRGVRNAKRTLMAGFTTVRDVFSMDFIDVALMRAVEAGWIEGPSIFPSGHAICMTGGHIDPSMLGGFAPGILEGGPEVGIADGMGEVLKAVRYQIKHGVKWIKAVATAGVLSLGESVGAQQYSEAEMRLIVEEAGRHGIRVAAHAHGTEGIKVAVRSGVTSIEHGSILDDESIKLMVDHGTYLVPTSRVIEAIDMEALLPQMRAKAMQIEPITKKSHRRAIEAGVKIAFGTDAAAFPHGENAKEFAPLVDLGMSPIDAIRAATLHAADMLGVDDRGTIAPDRLADLIAVPGNPLEGIRCLEDVRFVMKSGRVVKMEIESKRERGLE